MEDMYFPLQPEVGLSIDFPLVTRRVSAKIPSTLTPAFAYFLGFLRDGTVTRYRRVHDVVIYQKDKKFLEQVIVPLGQLLFGKRLQIRPSGEDFSWRLHSKSLFTLITTKFDYPESLRQIEWPVPQLILDAPLEIQKWYIAGFVDAEGSVCIEKGKPVIYIYQSWKGGKECPLLESIKQMLRKFGIYSHGPYLCKSDKQAFRIEMEDRSARLFLQMIPTIKKKLPCPPPKELETKWLLSDMVRKVLSRRNLVRASSTGGRLQDHIIRFEKRGREYILVARLSVKSRNRSESDMSVARKSVGQSVKALEVTRI